MQVCQTRGKEPLVAFSGQGSYNKQATMLGGRVPTQSYFTVLHGDAVMPLMWIDSTLQKCAKIQLFRIISVRIRKHDFQYSRYSQQQLTWPSVHCQTNTSPNSCAVDFSLRQVIWMPWSLVSKNGPRALLCWWHVVHLHWKWLNQRLDMHFWTHVPWCLLFARFWWEIPER